MQETASRINGSLASSLGAIPLLNLTVICVTALLALVIIAFVLNRVGFMQFGSFTIRKEQEGQTSMHAMDEENSDLDDYLHLRLRQMTNALRQRIINMFAHFQTCAMTKRTLSSALRYPLYESIGNNHFTKELMPGQVDKYRQRILDSLKDEYEELCLMSEEGSCANNELPPWKTASVIIEQFLDMWMRETANLVQDCARQKREVYKKYLASFTKSRDGFRISIAKSCIEKNTRYIESIGILVDSLDRDIRDRDHALSQS